MVSFEATVCPSCGERYGFDPDICRECGEESLETETVDGRGRVYARTTVRVPGSDHEGEEPFEICVVDLVPDERSPIRITARILDNPGLDPGDAVRYLEERDGTHYFTASGQ